MATDGSDDRPARSLPPLLTSRDQPLMALLKRKKRVLLLDDDPSMQRLVTLILQNEGFKVDVFFTGREAIAAAAKQSYDVLLLDVMMPNEGAMTVIKHLRANNPKLLNRSVLLTGTSQALIDSISGQVRAVVQKPFEPARLIEVVREVSA
jgi:DNA-binding response OmpR family regulator